MRRRTSPPSGKKARPLGRATLDVAIIAACAAAGRTGPGRDIDDKVFKRLNDSLAPAKKGFFAVTWGGWFGTAAGASALALAAGRKRLAIDLLGSAATAWLSAQALKHLLPLGRPYDRLDEVHRMGGPPRGHAFPSGHPAVAFAVARVLASEKNAPGSAGSAALSGAGLVALSRIAVGAHYPLDVIAGSALGDLAATAWLSAREAFS